MTTTFEYHTVKIVKQHGEPGPIVRSLDRYLDGIGTLYEIEEIVFETTSVDGEALEPEVSIYGRKLTKTGKRDARCTYKTQVFGRVETVEGLR